MDLFSQGPALDQVREDMWYIYSLSAQYHDDDLMSFKSSSSVVSLDGTTDHMDAEEEEEKAAMHHHTYSPTAVH